MRPSGHGEDNEAARPYIEGLVVREFSPLSSNWRADETAQEFLTASGVPVISEIDTRALVRHLRSRGVMRGVLSATGADPKELVERARRSPSMAGLDLATHVTTPQLYQWDKGVDACSPSDLKGEGAGIRFAHNHRIDRLRRLENVLIDVDQLAHLRHRQLGQACAADGHAPRPQTCSWFSSAALFGDGMKQLHEL